jgi:hypothetical protein
VALRSSDPDDPFHDLKDANKRENAEELVMIDLTETPSSGKEIMPPEEPKEDKRTKLAAFQCAICMDDVTNLTITHCGKASSLHLPRKRIAF